MYYSHKGHCPVEFLCALWPGEGLTSIAMLSLAVNIYLLPFANIFAHLPHHI